MPASFFDAFLASDPKACALLDPGCHDRAAWARAGRGAARRIAPALVEEIAGQQADLDGSAARRANLAALAAGAAACVTGQQVGLFGGPLYTLHKAASAVTWARAIAEASGVPCVPLFWLQTEDHDYEEVRRCRVLGAGGAIDLQLGEERPGEARTSIAQRVLGPEVADELARLAEALEPLPHGAEVSALLARCYAPGRPLAGAFAQLLGALFADEGLIVFDPRRPAVARLAAPLYRRAIDETEAIGAELAERARAIEAAGFSPQVPVRPTASLLFHHLDAAGATGIARGPRFRMEASDGGLRHAGDPAPIDRQALAGQLERDPLAFSTSALLRPVVQDALLPAAAYVAGPSELAYFAELAPLYRRFGVAPSLVVPRARIALFDPRAARLCEQLGVPLERAAAAPDGITTTADRIDPVALAARLTAPFVRELDGIAGEMPRRDRLTERALRRTKETVERAAARIAGRIARAAAEGGQVEAERSARLAELLAPGGVPQERVYNFAGFAARAGVPETIAAVVAAAAPPTGELRAVRL